MSGIDPASLLAAAELVDVLTGTVEREEAAFELGMRLGFFHGVDVGYAQAERELAEQWAETAKKILPDAMAGISGGQVSEREADDRARWAEQESRRMAREQYAEFTRQAERQPNRSAVHQEFRRLIQQQRRRTA